MKSDDGLLCVKGEDALVRFLTSHIGGQEAGRRPAPAPPEYSCAQAAPSTRPEADKEAARRTCWLGIPKIELSVFVPGPWVVFGASPEQHFSHAVSIALRSRQGFFQVYLVREYCCLLEPLRALSDIDG